MVTGESNVSTYTSYLNLHGVFIDKEASMSKIFKIFAVRPISVLTQALRFLLLARM